MCYFAIGNLLYYPELPSILTNSKDSVTNETSTDWTVVTTKDLSLSNLFLFNLFYDGETSPVAASETFNITDGSTAITTTSSSSSTSSTTASSSATSSATTPSSATTHGLTGSSTSAAAATTTGSVSGQSGGLNTGTKVGVGIAVSAVALGGIAMGYFLFRRRAKKQQYATPPHAAEQSPVPMEQKPADLAVGPTYDRAPYELHGLSGPAMIHELSGDATRY